MNGKGDQRRGGSESRRRYEDNYDLILNIRRKKKDDMKTIGSGASELLIEQAERMDRLAVAIEDQLKRGNYPDVVRNASIDAVARYRERANEIRETLRKDGWL